MRLCHNHVTEYEVISNLGSFCFSKHHHHPRRSWEGTAHLVVLKNQAKLLLTTMLFTLQTVSIYRMSVINMFFERMIFSGFSAILFLIFLLPTSHICSTCKIIIKQEGACMKLPLHLIEKICPLTTYKSRCFLASRTSLKSFRCPEATTIHYTTTLGVPTTSRILIGDSQKLSFSTLTKVSFLIFWSDIPIDAKLLPM